MTSKLVVGPVARGLSKYLEPFNIDNDSFPFLLNAFQWRGKVKRKRGTFKLGRLTRYFDSTIISYNTGSDTITLNGSGAGNLITGFGLDTLTPNAALVPGSIIVSQGADDYEDKDSDGILYLGMVASGSVNYVTGEIVIASEAGQNVSAIFRYYPDLPVMGLEALLLSPTQFPGTLAFDTKYSYNISTAFPYPIYDVSFYKNLPTGEYVGYVEKTDWTPTIWNGQDYQQFWTTNYEGALWATNGINVPFNITNIGMQYKPIVSVTVDSAGPPALATLEITAHGLEVGDFVFINEVTTTTGINFQTGYVVVVVDVDNVQVEFPNATLASNGTGGIAQYLTRQADPTKDCLRWYDGDPTNGNPTSPSFELGKGWVNFMPPLSMGDFGVGNLREAQWYLVGARVIVPFKDRLLFFGPVVQTSSTGSQVYLQDTVIYSQNGTPYYTASFTGDPSLATTVFNPILVPTNKTATPTSYWEDVTGFGGFLSAGLDQPIITVGSNEDVLIVGFTVIQTRLVYTGNDLIPFNFFQVNSEYGSGSTFSIIQFDQGVMTRGQRGIVITSQTQAQRTDLDIPDQVFEIKLTENGNERVTAVRDFINEWVYLTYPDNERTYNFPNQTMFYNYRDQSWALFDECYTTYGSFRPTTGFTWATVGEVYESWSVWNTPWNSGSSNLLQPFIIGGNQQGFVMFKDNGTGEGDSLYIQDITGNTVTSPDHCLNQGDYIIIDGALGTISSQVNGRIFSVNTIPDKDSFTLNPSIGSGTYIGGATITRMYVPQVLTKQFPVAWGDAKKTRIGTQRYLLTKTDRSQITLLIFLSQNDSSPYNIGPIVPEPNTINDSLIYSTVLYTCPEGTNLGLTPSNINLNMVPASQQNQIWHRVNTSLIGDTIQLGFTLSDRQMRAMDEIGTPSEITGATQAYPCVLTCAGQFSSGQMILIDDVEGMTELNGNIYQVITSDATTVTIDVDSTAFTTYTEGGTATSVGLNNQFAEIELHGFILDVYPSMELA